MRRYDVVHTHNTACQLFGAIASLASCTHLVTTEHNTYNRRRGNPLLRHIDRWMYGRYDRIVCISAKTHEALSESVGIDESRAVTINNGIDTSKFKSAVPASLGTGAKTRLMMVGAFREQKDQDTIIRALAMLPADVHLWLVGDGPRRNILTGLTAKLGLADRVHFTGIRTDIPELMTAADIIIMSSHWEGFGLAAVEGMAAGRPVIASDVDGLREVVDGAGLLFSPGNPESLTAAIDSLIHDRGLLAVTATACRERANLYSITPMTQSYAELYNTILSQ